MAVAVLFTKRCAAARIDVSMGSRGDCFDNACCGTFHVTLKKELIYRQPWPSRAIVRTAIFEYIEGWYNPRRRHSTLGYLSPADYEQKHAEQLERALNDTISGSASVAADQRIAAGGLTTRRVSTISVDLATNGPLPENALPPRTGSAQAATTAVKERTVTRGLSDE